MTKKKKKMYVITCWVQYKSRNYVWVHSDSRRQSFKYCARFIVDIVHIVSLFKEYENFLKKPLHLKN